jgi:GNAT superfamily N-acetyltransferase
VSPHPDVVPAGAADLDRLCHLIADAFHPLAPSRWLITDPAARRQLFPGYFRLYVEHALADGVVYTTPDRAAAALWLPAGPDAPDQPADYAERLAAATSPWTDRFVAFDAALEARHPAGIPHRYLAILAVRPGRQSQGTGTALLGSYHLALDRDGTPAYLEASDLRTRRLYLHHGYTDHGPPIDLPGGPLMYPMWRPPSPRPRPSAGNADPIPPAGM